MNMFRKSWRSVVARSLAHASSWPLIPVMPSTVCLPMAALAATAAASMPAFAVANLSSAAFFSASVFAFASSSALRSFSLSSAASCSVSVCSSSPFDASAATSMSAEVFARRPAAASMSTRASCWLRISVSFFMATCAPCFVSAITEETIALRSLSLFVTVICLYMAYPCGSSLNVCLASASAILQRLSYSARFFDAARPSCVRLNLSASAFMSSMAEFKASGDCAA